MTDAIGPPSFDPGAGHGYLPAPQPPAVLRWQNIYCIALGVVYVLLALGGLGMAIFRQRFVDAQNTPGELLVTGLLIFVGSGIFAVPFLAAPFLPRKRWVWVLHLVLIAVGLTSCACIPFCVPLLIFWIRPETQAWFGKRATRATGPA